MHLPKPIAQDLVFIGGGHSHAIALRKWGMNPIPGVKLTLITAVSHTPYSGMLPGYVAGLYDFEDCHIDLRPLAQFAQARMIQDQAVGLDLNQNRVLLANRPPIAFDLLSIDIGSTPAVVTVPGAKEHAIPVKPISQFLHYWDQLLEMISHSPEQPICLAIVGGGAGGVELAMAVQGRLQRLYEAVQQSANLEVHLFHRGDRLLPERSEWVSQRAEQVLRDRGVQIHLGESVSAIEAVADQKVIHCSSGLQVACERVFWVTRAAAAPWLQESGLATDEDGFMRVGDTLQSVSHPQVFGAGDVAAMVNYPRPKAGVFAVRQGKPLFDNLRRVLRGKAPQPFAPQREYLILLGTGDGQAIASRGGLGFGPSSLIWQWKDRIDRQFMQKFTQLKPMSERKESSKKDEKLGEAAEPAMHCAGCGSKVGSSVLERALSQLQAQTDWGDRPDILIGLHAPDDAAVIRIPAGQVMVQTIDYFRALIDDPFLFGQICANHCLSDLFAMGATPQSGLAIVTLPYATAPKQTEMLYQLLAGATQVLQAANAPLIGGHTTQGTELALGLTCNGIALPEQLWRKSDLKPGQALILTKALGTGTLFAADMQLKAKGQWIDAAIASMLLSNQTAAACLRNHEVTACTDVTGFGLLGHLLELVQASLVAVELDLNAVPILPGAKETIQQGILSSLHPQNFKASRWIENFSEIADRPLLPLLFDPQTSGGLLASVPSDRAQDCLSALRNAGYENSSLIGLVLPLGDQLPITIR
ncbi:selenide, water dikinase SelD [Phormidium tenue FACHB-886]|nr:selenide, water dikinase SelD [Phormidium tenue FACHB-886]